MIYDHLFKIVIFGDKDVGKSCLLSQYVNKTFTEKKYLDIGIEFKFKELIIDNIKIKVQIWTINNDDIIMNYNNPNGFIIIYDVTNKDSFKYIENKINIIRNYYTIENIPIIIIGNKIDKNNRNITLEEVNEFSKKNNIMNIEASIKHNINVDLIFEKLLKKILEQNPKSVKFNSISIYFMIILIFMIALIFTILFII